tara:strand:- start:4278 stop:6110 length:1833 start_codon:yes stop_codon:yes gene_type:complete
VCGIVGVFGLGAPVGIDDRALVRMRDTLTHRGPDDAGIWRCPWAALGHRRLSVIAPGPEGHQPMVTDDGRCALVYNGELYNDAELRSELTGLGVRFRSECDTETVLHALATWGERGVARLRGMFAIGFVDTRDQRVILARDPLGVKPLYTARVGDGGGVRVVFASEPGAVLAHPGMSARPDWVTVSAYLTTIRPTLGSRTMFEGVQTLMPGETRVYDALHPDRVRVIDAWDRPEDPPGEPSQTREQVSSSVIAHLRTDVPMCALLSGGLDSSAIAAITAARLGGGLNTYCAGAATGGFDDDFAHAAEMARRLDTEHRAVVLDEPGFLDRWGALIDRTGVPVSTPNETAIWAVAEALRADGHVVALSGEGADELFGGYAPPLMQAAEHVRSLGGGPDLDGGLFHLRSNAWVTPEAKPAVLRDRAWNDAGRDEELTAVYRDSFDRLAARAPADSPLQAHLRFHRRMNLPNLLRRLDSATMLASVEGRTPFADARVARFAESLPVSAKFVPGEPARTKIALREAFRGVLPAEVVDRPKASFPLPFQGWIGGRAGVLRNSAFARTAFTDEAVEMVASAPDRLWTLAWPMINIAMWGERWWGTGVPSAEDAAAAV